MCSNVHHCLESDVYWPRTLRSSVFVVLVAVLREWSGLEAVVERTLLGDEETVALLEGDAVSVDKNVSI